MAIGKVFHLIHMTGDLPALEAWYDDVFAVRRGFLDHHYLEAEQRDASLVVLGDCVIEPLAPAFRAPGWEAFPLGRFYGRFGPHWHSIAWYTDDAGELWQRCTDHGIRVFVEGGARTSVRPPPSSAIMTHPKDTVAQLEFYNPAGTAIGERDPRLRPDWDPAWWVRSHPLGLHGLAYTTLLTRDRERAKHIFVDVLGGTLLAESESALTGTADSYVRVGEDTVLQLSTPDRAGTLAAQDGSDNGEIHHAVAFRVEDLDRAEKYLGSKGIVTLARDETTLVTDPATTHGALFRWVAGDVPGHSANGEGER